MPDTLSLSSSVQIQKKIALYFIVTQQLKDIKLIDNAQPELLHNHRDTADEFKIA